ncbi:MAG: hypothetical protein AB8B55_00095 [Mariniblastus sp.]
MNNKGKNQRRVFRLRLPNDCLLQAQIAEKNYDVVEVSEFGIVVSSDSVEDVSGRFDGVITWSDGTNSVFNGELGRLSDCGRVIWKVTGIEMSNVVKEQRRILATYPLPATAKQA